MASSSHDVDLETCRGGGSVTLIFRRIEKRWRDEYLLNLAAAFATGGDISHVEIAIGNDPGSDGQQMSNVLRIYNDNTGAELCERTGRSPNYRYLQLGCTKDAEQRILTFAKMQIGKPFNNWAMARSILWPRKSTYRDYFCAELVAAALRAGGLMHVESNPGAATPQSLYHMYEKHAATTGNPYVLRGIKSTANTRKSGRSGYKAIATNQNITLSSTHSHPVPINKAVYQSTHLTHMPHVARDAMFSNGQRCVPSCSKSGVVNQLIHPFNTKPINRSYMACSHFSHSSQPSHYSPAEAAIRNAARGLFQQNSL